jgi:hypothetical protein
VSAVSGWLLLHNVPAPSDLIEPSNSVVS